MSKMPELQVDPHVRTVIWSTGPEAETIARAETREYAEQIITACNAFGPLVKACKAIYTECDGICPSNIGIEIWERLEAALTAAGVKENEYE